MGEYFTHFFPYWRCEKCGRRYHALENYCLFCKEKPKQTPLPPRHQYRDLEWLQNGKTNYYERDRDIHEYE